MCIAFATATTMTASMEIIWQLKNMGSKRQRAHATGRVDGIIMVWPCRKFHLGMEIEDFKLNPGQSLLQPHAANAVALLVLSQLVG
jgi:hypothetical protein